MARFRKLPPLQFINPKVGIGQTPYRESIELIDKNHQS